MTDLNREWRKFERSPEGRDIEIALLGVMAEAMSPRSTALAVPWADWEPSWPKEDPRYHVHSNPYCPVHGNLGAPATATDECEHPRCEEITDYAILADGMAVELTAVHPAVVQITLTIERPALDLILESWEHANTDPCVSGVQFFDTFVEAVLSVVIDWIGN